MKAGKRNTSQKKAIEAVFHEYDRPLTVEEILVCARQSVPSLNPATVYRHLRTLVDDGWLEHVVNPASGTLYERTGKPHHHHFHCRDCARSFELPGCPLKGGLAAPTGFSVEDHEVYLIGLCPGCNRRRKSECH